ncbi:CHAD domain-containing protein [Ralstonia holmesii]|uniref:CHAD domain-containing protein n=1 Tax=Ralstonia holmesii TaxID=3058602 RepID=UPI0031BAC548
MIASFNEAIGQAIQAETESGEPLGELAHASIAGASRQVAKALRRASNGGLQESHQTLIQMKRLCYLLEFFAEVLSKEDRKRIRRLEQLQDALGELNDVVIGAAYLGQVPVSPEYAAAYDLFVQWLRGCVTYPQKL